MLLPKLKAQLNTEITKFVDSCEYVFKCDKGVMLELWRGMRRDHPQSPEEPTKESQVTVNGNEEIERE